MTLSSSSLNHSADIAAEHAGRFGTSDSYVGRELAVVFAEFSAALRFSAHAARQREDFAALAEQFPDLDTDNDPDVDPDGSADQ